MQNILVVCVGNICRSPIAEALLARDLPRTNVWSAGLGAAAGDPADPRSIALATAHGIDLSAHRAQAIAGWMCHAAELILVMEEGHRAVLECKFPLVRGKAFRLGEFDDLEIGDPYRLSPSAFEQAYVDINRGVAHWVSRIRQLT